VLDVLVALELAASGPLDQMALEKHWIARLPVWLVLLQPAYQCRMRSHVSQDDVCIPSPFNTQSQQLLLARAACSASALLEAAVSGTAAEAGVTAGDSGCHSITRKTSLERERDGSIDHACCNETHGIALLTKCFQGRCVVEHCFPVAGLYVITETDASQYTYGCVPWTNLVGPTRKYDTDGSHLLESLNILRANAATKPSTMHVKAIKPADESGA